MDANSPSLSVAVVQAYVDGGNLKAALTRDGIPSFETVHFISYTEGKLRLLICGDCPSCDAPFLRNICNQKYCNAALGVMKRSIPAVQKVTPVFTHDDDFFEIVRRFGYTINLPIVPNESKTMHEISIIMLDYHPSIEAYSKILSRRGNDKVPISSDETTTWDTMIETYNAVWLIDDTAKAIDVDGDIAEGLDIIHEDFQQPPYMVEMNEDGAPAPMLMSYNPEFFNYVQYMSIVTSSN